MSKVPIVLCGKFESHITGISRALQPDYDVIHNCRSVEAATSEIPALLNGEAVQPSSGFGSNYNSSAPVSGTEVKAIIVGGGFAPDEFDAIKTALDQVKPMPFFRADVSKSPPGSSGPPPLEVLKQRLVVAMGEAAKEGGGECKAGVHLF